MFILSVHALDLNTKDKIKKVRTSGLTYDLAFDGTGPLFAGV